MQVTLIGCPFKTSYGPATESLKKALEKRTGRAVEWVASNCGCGDRAEISRQFQMPGCKYFEMLTISGRESGQGWKKWLKLKARKFFYYFRAQRYRKLSAGAEVVNFQQTLNAYGNIFTPGDCAASPYLLSHTTDCTGAVDVSVNDGTSSVAVDNCYLQ